MAEAEWRAVLRTEDEEGSERLCLSARRRGDRFVFGREGDWFTVFLPQGAPPRISRRGSLCYRLVLDEGRETDACVRSAYGSFGVRVRTLCARVRRGRGICSLQCEYVLDFSGYERRCSVTFSARAPLHTKEERG